MIRRIAVAFAVMLSLTAIPSFEAMADSTAAPEKQQEHILGNSDAPVTLLEYGSVGCPICGRFNETVMAELKVKYIATGKVRYIYRPMTTGNFTVAMAGHRLAECAGDDKYFQVIDSVMHAQPEMDKGGEPEQYANAMPVLEHIAREVGLTEQQLLNCLKDKAALQRLYDLNVKYMTEDGITGTPTFFINGKKLERKAGTIADFDEVLAPLLAGNKA